MESYPYRVKEGQRYINLNPGRLFVQQTPKKERDQKAHLCYVSVYMLAATNLQLKCMLSPCHALVTEHAYLIRAGK